MQIHMTEIGSVPGREIPFSFTATAAELDAVAANCVFVGPIEITGVVMNTGTGFRVRGVIHDERQFACDRCLEECHETQEIPFEEIFRQGEAEPLGDATPFTGDVIELDALVRDTLLTAQPLHSLCKPDCKGLCPVCGANLNHGECGCDRFVPDPRLAMLKNFRLEDDSSH